MRETEAKMTKADQFTKLQFLNNKIDQNANFVKLPSAKSLFLNKFKSFLMIAQFLILPFFMSVSLVRENLRGLRKKIKTQNPNLAHPNHLHNHLGRHISTKMEYILKLLCLKKYDLY